MPSFPSTCRPCTSAELLKIIIRVCGDDYTAVSITQEILVYLAMFIRSEPELFAEMLRLRIGLIHNVMVLELSRTMSVSCELHYVTLHYIALTLGMVILPAEDAVEKLLDLSPFDLKHLLHLIFSSKEFTVDESKCTESFS